MLCIVWPWYKDHKYRPRRRSDYDDNVHVTVADEAVEPKQCGSNGTLPQDEKPQVYEETSIPPYPSMPPPTKPKPVETAPALDNESDVEMQRGPGSDDDLNTIPEDMELSDDNNEEYDTLMKKEDVQKPKSYENSHKDSAV